MPEPEETMIEQLIKEVIKVLPKAEIWLGGPEASYRAKEFMQKYSFLRGGNTRSCCPLSFSTPANDVNF